MKKLSITIIAVTLAVASSAQAQVDEVRFIDRATKKEDSVRGTIDQETPAGIRVKQRDTGRDIQAGDIAIITYQVPGVSGLDFRAPFGKEARALAAGVSEKQRKDLLAEALQGFEDLLPKVSSNARAKRYIQFKIAMVKAVQAETELLKQDAAIAALKAFKDEHPDSWQIVAAMKTLAKTLEAKGDIQSAAKTYEDLGKIVGIPSTVKVESDVLAARLLMRDSKYADAEARLKAVNGALPPGDPQKPSVLILLAEVQLAQNNLDGVEPLLRGAIASTTDADQHARAHNALGDYFQKKNQAEDAFWEYLKVDVLYNQDREQHAKALYFLSKLFATAKKDALRAQECKDRLADKAFAGLEYAKRAAGEK